MLAFLKIKRRGEEVKAHAEAERRVAKEFETAVDRLREQMSLPSLVNLNRIVLDQYHGIATEQAESSFRSSRRAMNGGFAWLLVCFAAVLFVPAAANAQLLIGSLAVAGGALSAFLGKTYIRVYERSLSQLNRYFEQPLLNSYLLSAERVIGEMGTGKDDAYRAVLGRLLDSSGQPSEEPAAKPKVQRRPRARTVTTGEPTPPGSDPTANGERASRT